MNAIDLIDLLDALTTATLDDPVLRLAHTVAWLDPLRIHPEVDDPIEDYYYGSGDDLEAALYVTRRCFPDLYADAVAGLREGTPARQIEQRICDGISVQGIPMDTLEFEGAWAYGVPMPACGIDPADPNTLEPFRGSIETLYALFGIEIDGDGYHVVIPPDAYDVALMVALSLEEELRQQQPIYERLFWLLGWAFSMTNNSSVDHTWETLAEFQPLDWSPENVAFARLIIEECDQIMTAALAGLDELQTHDGLRAALARNIVITRKKLAKRGGRPHDLITEHNRSPFRLAWPHLADGAGTQ